MKDVVALLETQQSIIRNVVRDVVRLIKAVTQMPADTDIYYGDELVAIAQPGSTIDDINKVTKLRTKSSNRVEIETNFNYDRDMFLTVAKHRNEFPDVFHDAQTGTYLKPVYFKSELKITVKFFTHSQTHAENWRSSLNTRMSSGQNTVQHQLKYHIAIPSIVIETLKEVHRLRESTAPYGQTFDEYLKDKFISRATYLENQSGSTKTIAIAENQQAVGFFSFDPAVETDDKNKDEGNTSYSFDYTLRFDKPENLAVTYPCMVHNTLLPAKFIVPVGQYQQTHSPGYTSVSQAAYNNFSILTRPNDVNTDVFTFIPYYDTNELEETNPYKRAMFTGLCSISQADKHSLLNLKELGDYQLDQDILAFMQEVEYQYLTEPGQSIFSLSRFEFNQRKNTTLVCDNLLNLTSSQELDIRIIHRVMLSIVIDFTYITPAAIKRLVERPNILRKVLGYIDEQLRLKPVLTHYGVKNKLTKEDLYRVDIPVDYIPNGTLDTGRLVLTRSVQTSYIQANKKS